jgi:hypothetical protein
MSAIYAISLRFKYSVIFFLNTVSLELSQIYRCNLFYLRAVLYEDLLMSIQNYYNPIISDFIVSWGHYESKACFLFFCFTNGKDKSNYNLVSLKILDAQ